MFYKQDEEALYPPQINRPDYKRGYYYCSKCGTGYYTKRMNAPSMGRRQRRKIIKISQGEALTKSVTKTLKQQPPIMISLFKLQGRKGGMDGHKYINLDSVEG